MVTRIIKRHPDLLENPDPSNGWTSLHYAGYHGRYLICVFLIQSGHDQENISLDFERNTPLHLAAKQNQEQTVHYLSQHLRTCLDWPNTDLDTPLLVAAKAGHQPCITLLLDFGADVEKPGKDGNRAIHVAAAYGHLKAIRTLVERKADTSKPNSLGWKPEDYSYSYQVKEYISSLITERRKAGNTVNLGTLYTPFAKPTQQQETPSKPKVIGKSSPGTSSSGVSLSSGISSPGANGTPAAAYSPGKLPTTNRANAPSAPSPLHHSTILSLPVVAKPQNFYVQQYQYQAQHPPPSAFSLHSTPASSPKIKSQSVAKPHSKIDLASPPSLEQSSNTQKGLPFASPSVSSSNNVQSIPSTSPPRLGNVTNTAQPSSSLPIQADSNQSPSTPRQNPNISNNNVSNGTAHSVSPLKLENNKPDVHQQQTNTFKTAQNSNLNSSPSDTPSKTPPFPNSFQNDIGKFAKTSVASHFQIQPQTQPQQPIQNQQNPQQSVNNTGMLFGPPLQSRRKEPMPQRPDPTLNSTKTGSPVHQIPIVKKNSMPQLKMSAHQQQHPKYLPLKSPGTPQLLKSSKSAQSLKPTATAPTPSNSDNFQESPKQINGAHIPSTGNSPVNFGKSHVYNNPYKSPYQNGPHTQHRPQVSPPRHVAPNLPTSKSMPLLSVDHESRNLGLGFNEKAFKGSPPPPVPEMPFVSLYTSVDQSSKPGTVNSTSPNANLQKQTSHPHLNFNTKAPIIPKPHHLHSQVLPHFPIDLVKPLQFHPKAPVLGKTSHCELNDSLEPDEKNAAIMGSLYKLTAGGSGFRQAASTSNLSLPSTQSCQHLLDPFEPQKTTQSTVLSNQKLARQQKQKQANVSSPDQPGLYELGSIRGNKSMPNLDNSLQDDKDFEKLKHEYQKHHRQAYYSRKNLDALASELSHSDVLSLFTPRNPPPIPPKRIFPEGKPISHNKESKLKLQEKPSDFASSAVPANNNHYPARVEPTGIGQPL